MLLYFLLFYIMALFFSLLLQEWSPSPSAYCLSNEDKVATRAGHILSHILWSHEPSLRAGNTLTVKVLDDADKSPGEITDI